MRARGGAIAARVRSIEEFRKRVLTWYGSDHRGFRTLFDKAIDNVRPIPEGTDPDVGYDWHGKSIEDLCDFFAEWYHWMPHLADGLEYIQKFSWFYYENPYGLTFVTCGPGFEMTQMFVQLRGRYMSSPESLPLVKEWIDELGDKMDQFIVPRGGFKDFNQFFVRKVKKSARPVSAKADDSVVVSPADCILNMIVDDLTVDTRIPVKTVALNVEELLDGSTYAASFVGGTAVSCILMPDMYHRYHFPVSGHVVESNEDVHGEYFGIKDFPDLLNKGNVGYGYDYSVFERFRRGYVVIRTTDHGLVGMVPVGLNTVASVVFKRPFKRVTASDTPVPVVKGAELGRFQYGGSLNILLFEKGRFRSTALLQGQRIGELS